MNRVQAARNRKRPARSSPLVGADPVRRRKAKKYFPSDANIESQAKCLERKIMTNVMRAASILFVGVIFAGLAAAPAWTQSAPAQTPSPSGGKVYFINLKMSDVITVTLR